MSLPVQLCEAHVCERRLSIAQVLGAVNEKHLMHIQLLKQAMNK